MRAYVLAGGASRRFGSNKARAELDGEPLIVRLHTMLRPLGFEVTAVARDTGAYEDLGIQTICDRQPGLGPLAGLDAALADHVDRHGEGWVLLVPCDMVTLQAGWIQALQDGISRDSLAVCIRDDRWQPMPGLYHTLAREQVSAALARGERSMHSLLERLGTGVGPPRGWDGHASVNTPAELARHQIT